MEELKHVIALLLEDAKHLHRTEPNAGTESRIRLAQQASKAGEFFPIIKDTRPVSEAVRSLYSSSNNLGMRCGSSRRTPLWRSSHSSSFIFWRSLLLIFREFIKSFLASSNLFFGNMASRL